MSEDTVHNAPSKITKLILLALCVVTFTLLVVKGPSRAEHHDFLFQGPDDVMRMVQVIDWAEGASWYDVTQKRLNPPHGVAMHWTRLPDLPLITTYSVAKLFVTQDQAIYFTTAAVPPLLGIFYLLAFIWTCAPLVKTSRVLPLAGIIGLVSMTQTIGFAFIAGRIDHHNWQLIFATLGLGGILRVYRNHSHKAAIVAAIAASLGLWVGSEALIPLGLCCSALALYWVKYNTQAIRPVRTFAYSLALTTTGLYLLAVHPSQWSVPACDTFSIVSVSLTASIAIFFISISLVSATPIATRPSIRLIISATTALLCIGLLAWLFPNCQHGPYSALSEEWKNLLPHIAEARNFISVLESTPFQVAYKFSVPIAALGLYIYMIFKERTAESREIWGVLFLFTTGATIVALWQIRGSVLANVFASFSFTWVALSLGEKFLGGARSYKNLFQSILPIIIVGLLPTIAMYMTLLATWQEKPKTKCDWVEAAKNLGTQPVGQNPALLIATLGNHPEFLLLTKNFLLGAYYHRDKEGMADTLGIFDSKPEVSKSIIDRRGVDLLFLCASTEDRKTVAEGVESLPLKGQLAHGKLPDWLEKTYEKDDLMGFSVRR